MRLLICGGRVLGGGWYDKLKQSMEMFESAQGVHVDIVIQGGARGADAMGKQWAVEHNRHYAEVPAIWGRDGNAAGPMRNKVMLHLQPDYCISLPGGSGTENMRALCRSNNIPLWCPYG